MTYEQAALSSGKSSADISYWEDLEKRYKELYESQVASNNAAAASATERTLREIDEQINALNKEYREKNRELYRGYRDADRHLSERMAASGITGGLSESGHLRLENGYRSGVTALEQQKSADQGALRAKGLKAETDNTAAADKANAAAEKEFADNKISVQKLYRTAEEKRAAELAETGDFSGYERLGYSSEQIEQLRRGWENKNPQVAMRIAAAEKRYSAEQVAAMSPILAQYYLAALGFYGQKINGIWDGNTENAYKKAFGVRSGR